MWIYFKKVVRNRDFYLNKSSFPFTIKPSKGRVHLFCVLKLDFLFLIYGLYLWAI